MSILKRPPGDDFTFRLFFRLTSKMKFSVDKIYLWSAVIDPTYNFGWWPEEGVWCVETELDYRNLLSDLIKSDLVILGVKDHLTSGDFNYKKTSTPSIVSYLNSLFEFYDSKQFILFTSVENLEYYINRPNVKLIPWGGDITNHQREYQKLMPVVEKNLDSKHTFLSLNRNKRAHRAMLVSLLYGVGMQDSGLISCMFKDSIEDLFEYTEWEVSDDSVYLNGFNILKNTKLSINDDPEIYHNNNNDNVSNFKNSLKTYYENTFVEIDFLNSTVKRYNYAYLEGNNKFKDVKGKEASWKTDIHTEKFANEVFTNENARQFLVMRDYRNSYDAKSFSGEKNFRELVSRRIMYNAHMSATQVQATTSGRLDLSPGDVIQVNIRELNASTNQTEKNEQLSGRYLITHISNVCNSDILNTQLTLFKYDWSDANIDRGAGT